MALNTFVGTFAAQTTTGAQAIAGVGFTPKAIIWWSSGNTSPGSFTVGVNNSIGFLVSTTATSNGAVAGAIASAVNTSATERRVSKHGVLFVNTSGTVTGQADLQSFDAGGFTLTWTTAAAAAYRIHFLALGGADLTNAAVLNWTLPTTSGNHSVTGMGFQPDCVLSIQAGGATALDTSGTGSTIGLGAMDAAGEQWTTTYFSASGGTSGGNPHCGQLTSAFYLGVGSTGSFGPQFPWVSMDADGFTFGTTIASGQAQEVFSLGLKGAKFQVGSFAKATGTAPASQAVTGVGFLPAAVLLVGDQQIAGTSSSAVTRQGIGATDGTNVSATAVTDALAKPTVSKAYSTPSACYVKANNDTGTVDASATLTSLDSGGFTLSWGTNDAVATQVCYLAVGSVAVAAPFPPFPLHPSPVYRM